MKKIISCVLALVMTLSIFGTFPVSAEPKSDSTAPQIGTNVSVAGTNSFGNLLTEELNAEMDRQEENNGCNIFSIEMNGATADVSFETTESCTLVVAIYEDNGEQMLASGDILVSKEDKEALVTIETDNMPDYYYLRGYLVDSDTMRPICTVYESPNYTQEMQAFFAKTVDDFDSEKVLNLDEDKTNNFAVFSDKAIGVPSDDTVNQVTKADDTSATYVIEHADATVKQLKKGDIFYCPNGDEFIIVKVDTISITGSTVTITGQDTSMEEVFDYIKINTDQIKSNGSKMYQQKNVQSRAISFEGSETATVFETSFLPAIDGLSGTLKMTLTASLKLYLSKKYQYVEMKMGYALKLAVSIGQKKTISIPLPEMTFPTPVGVNISVTPSFDISVGGKVEISGTLSGQIGFAYDSDEGNVKNMTSAPTFDSVLKLEVEVSFVLSLKPNVNFIDDKVVSIYLEGTIGIYATAEQVLWQLNDDKNIKHECKKCFDGEINFKSNTGFGIEAIGIKILDRGVIEQSYKLDDFYYSVDHDIYGFGSCPYQQYCVNVKVVDSNYNLVSEAYIIKNDPVGDMFLGKTDKDGRLDIWLSNGEYTLTAKNNTEISSRNITVQDYEKSIVIQLQNHEEKLKDVIASKGTICTWEYADYDGNGTKEAFAIVGTKSMPNYYVCSDIAGIYFISTNGEVTQLNATNPNLKMCMIERCTEYAGKKFFSCNTTAGGSSSETYLFGVKNGKCYELEISGTIVDFYSRDGICYATKGEFLPEGGHVWTEYALSYNEETQEFSMNDQASTQQQYATVPQDVIDSNALQSVDEEYGVPTTWGAICSCFGLEPNAIYNFYVMKSAIIEDPFNSDNLLYIAQVVSDADGKCEISYVTKELCQSPVTIIKAASKTDLSSAQVSVPSIVCDGTEQFAEPKVTLDGKTLKEGQDYDIEKRYSAIYPGEYELVITGIRDYTGKAPATYTVTCTHRFENGQCIICKSLKQSLGDANGDDVVGMADIVVLQNYLLARRTEISAYADVNQDGIINAWDLSILKSIVLDAMR